jgi:hypothetical protein
MYNGGLVGLKNNPDVYRADGVWSAGDVAGYLEKASWFFTRSATVNATSFIEGDSITVTISAPRLPDGTNLYWTVVPVDGELTTEDFDNNLLNGPLAIQNGEDTTTRKLRNDKEGDRLRKFSIAVRSESIFGPIIATTPVLTVDDLARGGQAVFDRGGYRYHKFTSSSNFKLNRSTALTVFMVGGGGGGGGNGGGGGGGGGVVYTNITPSAGTYFIQIGGGGSAAPNGGTHGGTGGNTVFPGYLTAFGGGGGGSRDTDRNGYSGGSGGGGSSNGGGGAGTPGQGNNGGAGIIAGSGEVQSTGGGGGGYGGGGANGGAKDAGNGGPGGGFDPGGDGALEYYAGGGGGGRTVFGATGANGQGQGENRGGGGKGGSGGNPSFPASAGDTGVCFIRYLIPT